MVLSFFLSLFVFFRPRIFSFDFFLFSPLFSFSLLFAFLSPLLFHPLFEVALSNPHSGLPLLPSYSRSLPLCLALLSCLFHFVLSLSLSSLSLFRSLLPSFLHPLHLAPLLTLAGSLLLAIHMPLAHVPSR